MAALADLVEFLDRELNTGGVVDYSGAVNGLQVANDGKVDRVIAAVDASLPVIEKAAVERNTLLIVHHGLFWRGVQPITGVYYRKLKTAIDAGLAIYSSHLPLDLHPQWGNNVRLAEAIGLTDLVPFLAVKGQALGVRGNWLGSREELLSATANAVGGPVHICPAGPQQIKSVGIITGGAGSEVEKVATERVDAFITGEGPHWSFPLAEELQINLLYAGHYATETFGVTAIAEELAAKFSLPWNFIDHPTGL